MVIHVPADLIEKAKSDISIAKTLKLLFWLFDSGKHSWFLRPSDDPEIFSIPLLASFQEFITKSITDDLYSHNNPTVLVRVCTPDYILERKKSFAEKRIEFKTFLDDKRLTAHDDFGNIHEFISIEIVETFLNRPLSIILENAESDGLFIKTCLKLIAGIDTEQCFLELVHGGGSTLPMVAENIKGLQRVVCIVDSDKISPIQTPNNKKGWIRNIKKICNKYGYGVHVLNKHEMENYIPDEALKRHLIKSSIDPDNFLYFWLTNEQKNYFDLKNGRLLWSDKCGVVQHAVNSAVVETSSTVESDLYCPFGDQIWKAFACCSTAKELSSRDGQDELITVVNLVLRLL